MTTLATNQTTRAQSAFQEHRRHGTNGKSGKNGDHAVAVAATPSDPLRTLPNSLEAEQGVLGSMLISPVDVIGECVEKIDQTYFYHPPHIIIYPILVEFWTNQKPLDVITLTQVLRDRNLLETIGGPAYVTHLFTFTPTAASAGYYLEIVWEKYILRQLILTSTETVARAYAEQGEVRALLDDAERRMMDITNIAAAGTQLVTMQTQVMTAIEAIESLYTRKGAITGLATGFRNLDLLTNGLQPAEMTVIAARPSMGKTAFCCQIAEHVGVVEKKAVAIFSLEMSSQQLVQRMLCSRARVSLSKIRDGFLSERDFPNLTAAADKIAHAPIHIDDSAGLTILELRAKARRLKQMHDIQLIVIDYLQLLKGSLRRGQDNREQEVAEVSSGVKALAKELSIPIIVLAQLNRNPEARAGGKPRLSDLRESGSIEADADMVGLLLRSEYYADDDESKEEERGKAELIVAKQRNGPVGELKFTFLKEFTRFEERAEETATP